MRLRVIPCLAIEARCSGPPISLFPTPQTGRRPAKSLPLIDKSESFRRRTKKVCCREFLSVAARCRPARRGPDRCGAARGCSSAQSAAARSCPGV